MVTNMLSSITAPLSKFGFKKILLGSAIAIVGLIGYSNIFTVDQSERAVVTIAGDFSSVVGPGLHFTIPFVGNYTKYSIMMKQLSTDKLNTYTIDNQEVDAILVIQYSIPEEEIKYMYSNVPGMSRDGNAAVLHNMVIDRWKKVAGKYNVSDIANQRGKIVADLNEVVKKDAIDLYHVRVIDVQLYNLDYQPSYRDAQAKAATVKTEIEASQGLNTKAKIDADTVKITAEGAANQSIETARGRAESTRLQAIAESESIKIRGQAEAGAQKLMADAIASNPNLIEYQKALRWNGALPQNIYAGAPIPFINLETKK